MFIVYPITFYPSGDKSAEAVDFEKSGFLKEVPFTERKRQVIKEKETKDESRSAIFAE